MSPEELKVKFLERLQEEYIKKRNESLKIYDEIKAFNHACKSPFFKIKLENDLTCSWSADLVKSKFQFKL